jgi:hypothetical protein
MTRDEQIEIVELEVANHFASNVEFLKLEGLSSQERNHILSIGTSILCTKWGVGYEGGSFVQSFVRNDLMGAIGRADNTTYKGFKFFASLLHNVGTPYKLLK